MQTTCTPAARAHTPHRPATARWALLLLPLTIGAPGLESQSHPAATATAAVLASTANPSTLGQSISLTATVTPPTATGKVTFYDGSTILETEPVRSGKATLATTMLPSGTRAIKALYGGDSTFAPSTSMPLAQTVVPLPSNAFQPLLTYPAGTQIGAVNTAGGSAGSVLAVGDFNGDGKPDLATIGQKEVIVLLGNGDGTFQPPARYPTAAPPVLLLVGDFNGDGKTDLATVEQGSATSVGILLGNGDGAFQSESQPEATIAASPGANAAAAAVADLNGDGKADIVIAITFPPTPPPFSLKSSNIAVLQGNGDGSFQPVAFSDGSTYTLLSLAVGDFNSDGVADLGLGVAAQVITASGLITGGIEVLQGKGDGTFKTPPPITIGDGPQFYPTPSQSPLFAADLNGDGKLDLISAGSVLLGNGDGTFQAPVAYAGVGPQMAVGDINGDGRLDVVQNFFKTLPAGGGVNFLDVFLGNGDGTFAAATTYPVGALYGGVALADFNGDGRLDIATMDGVLLGATTAVPALLSILSGDNQAGTIGAMLAQNLVVEVLVSDGNPYLGAPVTFAVAPGSATINPTTVTTASNGTAATKATLGPTAGPIQITASVPGLTAVTFSETASAIPPPPPPPQPQILTGGAVSAGLSQPPLQVASQNAILAIFGQNFAPAGTFSRATLANNSLPTNFAGVCVAFGNQRAPIFLVTPTQLNFQVPQLPSPPASVTVQVTVDCDASNQSASNTVTLPVQAAAPEFFYAARGANGNNPIAAVDGLTGGAIGDPVQVGPGFKLAYPGELVVIYATGLGLTNPPIASGQLPTEAQVTGLTISIDGVLTNPSSVQYAGSVPNNAGLYQLNLVLPTNLPPGDHSIVMSLAGANSPSSAYISVGPAR